MLYYALIFSEGLNS